jgi:uncharacterized protein
MPGPAGIFKELHRLRQHARDLQSELERGPRILKAQEDKLANQEVSLKDYQESIKKFKVAILQKESQIKAKQQQIAKHEKQRNEAKEKKEYDALNVEIASDKKDVQKIEDEILADMEQVESMTAQIPLKEQESQKVKQDIARVIDDIQARRKTLTDLLQQAHQQIEQVEATLPEDVRTQYNRLVSAMGADSISAVRGRTCVACYTEITAQNYNELRMEQFVVCKSCGRILYLADS